MSALAVVFFLLGVPFNPVWLNVPKPQPHLECRYAYVRAVDADNPPTEDNLWELVQVCEVKE